MPLPSPLRPAVVLLAALAPGLALAQTTPSSPARRPAGEEGAPRAPSTPRPAAPALAEETPAEMVARINASLNNTPTLIADFQQSGGDGRRAGGRVSVQRPGKVRFEYNPPSPVEVIADGQSVVVRDRKLNTQDLYPIGQTPLKFLLSSNIDIARDAKLVSVAREGERVVAQVEDRRTLGGTSRIALEFTARDYALRGWTVVDPQGYTTTVRLANAETGRRPDPKLFVINYVRDLDVR